MHVAKAAGRNRDSCFQELANPAGVTEQLEVPSAFAK
jgi:hypothetical protein